MGNKEQENTHPEQEQEKTEDLKKVLVGESLDNLEWGKDGE